MYSCLDHIKSRYLLLIIFIHVLDNAGARVHLCQEVVYIRLPDLLNLRTELFRQAGSRSRKYQKHHGVQGLQARGAVGGGGGGGGYILRLPGFVLFPLFYFICVYVCELVPRVHNPRGVMYSCSYICTRQRSTEEMRPDLCTLGWSHCMLSSVFMVFSSRVLCVCFC